MKKHHPWQGRLVFGLAILSVALYLVHYAVFRDWHHILIYTLHDIAFLPIEVLLVTLVIHRLLEWPAETRHVEPV